MSFPAIRVTDVSKCFEVYDKPRDLALEALTRRKRHRTFHALDGVSFEVEKGEVLGIIGSNGAGKSTLLKIITGVLDPTAGSVEIRGKVTAILELGLGFNMEYTGRENIRVSALLYGMTQGEIARKLDDIIDFSGLAEFIDLPIKTYSSGMCARLAFSIATAADPEILIIDEALAAGDAMFVQKCLRRIRKLCNSGHTVLLVSHGTGLLAQLCKRVAWLDKGRLKAIGPALSVIQGYDLAAHAGADSQGWIEEIPVEPAEPLPVASAIALPNASSGAPQTDAGKRHANGSAEPEAASAIGAEAADTGSQHPFIKPAATETRNVFRRGPFFIDSVELLDARQQPARRLVTTLPFSLKVHYRSDGDTPDGSLGIAIAVNRASDLAPITQWFTQNIMPSEKRESYADAAIRIRPAKAGTITLDFPYAPYAGGDYLLSVGLLANEPANWEFYEYRHLWYPFTVDDGGLGVGAPLFFRPTLTHAPLANGAGTGPNGRSAPAAATLDPDAVKTLREEIAALCVGKGGYPHAWPRHPACPCCGSGSLRPAFAKFGFEHKRCDACGFVCVDPYPPDDVASALYGGRYYTNVRELFELPRAKRGGEATPFSVPNSTLADIAMRATNKRRFGRWLDVGGGLGVFGNLIAQVAPGWDVAINEFNPRSVEIANELYGLKTLANTASELLAKGETFDVISSVAVLEHVANPFQFVKDYARLLKPGGTLVTVVPNFTRLNATVSRGSSANVVPPFHLSLFNSSNLRRLLERSALFSEITVEDSGIPAFSLIQHVDFGEHWDVLIPTNDVPEPRGMQIRPYDAATSRRLNVLAEADQKMDDYFGETDGRLVLIAFARTKA